MKRTDIETGKVYGYTEDRAYISRYSAVMVLSTELYMTSRYGARETVPAPRGSKMQRAGTGRNRIGMLVVYLYQTDHDSVRKLRALVSVERALDALNGRNDVSTSIYDPDDPERQLASYRVLTNAGYLHGDYYELTRKLAEDARKREELAEQSEQVRLAALGRYRELMARAGKLGLKDKHYVGDHSHPTGVTLSFEHLEKLLSLAESAVRANQQAGINAGGLEYKDI